MLNMFGCAVNGDGGGTYELLQTTGSSLGQHWPPLFRVSAGQNGQRILGHHNHKSQNDSVGPRLEIYTIKYTKTNLNQ